MRTSTKKFTLSTESMNSLGFRVRTAGINTTQFEKNPVMLWMHQRPEGKSKDEVLPLGNFTNLQFSEGTLTGIPVFDDTDEFALKIFNKVENGTIRMASAGLIPLTWKEVEGEKWLWESILVEATICDRGSNPDALAVALYDQENQLITLSDNYFKQVINTNMKLIQLKAEDVAKVLQLTADATEEQFMAKVQEVVTLTETQAKTILTLTADKQAAENAKKVADEALVALKAEVNKDKIIQLKAGAVKDRKGTQDEIDSIVELAGGDNADPVKLAAHFEKMTPQVSVEEALKLNVQDGTDFSKLTYDELEKSGQIVKLYNEHPVIFREKFKAKFGKEYDGKLPLEK